MKNEKLDPIIHRFAPGIAVELFVMVYGAFIHRDWLILLGMALFLVLVTVMAVKIEKAKRG